MRTLKAVVIAVSILIGLIWTIGALAQRARPMAFSPPPEVQGQAFSVDDSGPITLTGVHEADVLGAAFGPLVMCEDTGLACEDTVTGARDDVIGLSFGYDFMPVGLPPVQFSVGVGSQGISGTAVWVEAGCSPAEPQADVFETALDGLNEQDLDGDGTPCGVNAGFSLGLDETGGDNLDAVERDPCLYVDPDCDGMLDEPIYVTLAPGSPTLAEIGASSADILITQGDVPPQVWAVGAADLGLTNGDVIDALCVFDDGDQVYGSGDRVLFSLAPGSPTLSAWSAGAADVLQPRGVRYAAAWLGLLATDNVDALSCAEDLPTFQLRLPLVGRNF